MSDDELVFDDESEATAVIQLSEVGKSGKARGKDQYLLVQVRGSELGRVRELLGDDLLIGRHNEAEVWIGDDGVSRRHARLVRQGEAYVIEDLGSANGTYVQGERVERRVLRDGDQVQLGPTAIFRYSVTDNDQRALLEQLYSASVTDALTGARNREYLESLLVSELSYAKRHGLDLSFVMFDLDHFKKVNDTHGHPAGDAVLVAVANAVRGELRAEDMLCRYGGEEFAIVLRGIDLLGASKMAERIRVTVATLDIEHEGKVLRATMSVGCSTRSELEEPTREDLIAVADRRLYEAKHSGRNRVVSAG